jgi:hypothetical protein
MLAINEGLRGDRRDSRLAKCVEYGHFALVVDDPLAWTGSICPESRNRQYFSPGKRFELEVGK